MSRLFLTSALLLTLPFAAAAADNATEMADASSQASIAYDIVPRSKWDVEVLRELARNIADMPAPVAGEALWAVAKIPVSIDTTNIYANAISSRSARTRSIAASILVGADSPDLRRLLINFVTTERDEEIVKLVVRGIASKPRPRAVALFMAIMSVPAVQGPVVEESTRELRRITHADVPANAGAWRDWWLDNEDKFSE